MSSTAPSISKPALRKSLRLKRREHVELQSDAIRALLFHRPPTALLDKIAPDQTIGLYHATPYEAPANGYAKFFQEQGLAMALPHFSDENSQMEFREHTDPLQQSDLTKGPYNIMQPSSDARILIPDLIFVPLLGFTDTGERLGQGGGHYDRYLGANTDAITIGMAWDVQLCDELPTVPHDMALDAVITPTRMYGPF